MHHANLDQKNRSFGIGILLNVGFVAAEVVFGLLSSSLALLADAGHNASDVLGLLLGWAGNRLMQKPSNEQHTYGWRGVSIIAAMLNAFILLIAVGWIVLEAWGRFGDPGPVAGDTVIWVAALGTLINLGTALLFHKGRDKDLNVRGAFVHMAADAGVSAGVVIAGLLIRITGARWLDPLVSLLIAAIILWSAVGLLRDAFHLAVGGVPKDIELSRVEGYLAGLPGVQEVHDLHIWGLSTAEVALTAHLVKPDPDGDDALAIRAMRDLHQMFEIHHVTLQWERGKLDRCHEIEQVEQSGNHGLDD